MYGNYRWIEKPYSSIRKFITEQSVKVSSIASFLVPLSFHIPIAYSNTHMSPNLNLIPNPINEPQLKIRYYIYDSLFS